MDVAVFSYIGDFLLLVSQAEGFDFCLWFLGEGDKQVVGEIAEGLGEFGYPDFDKVKQAYEVK